MKGTRTQYFTLIIMVFLMVVLISLFPERSTISTSEQDQSDRQYTQVNYVSQGMTETGR